MQKVEILKDVLGSPNGYDVVQYKKGDVVELNDSLVKGFFEQGVCKIVEEKPVKKNTKKTNPVKENKAKKDVD